MLTKMAFSQLEIARYQDLINHKAWLTLYWWELRSWIAKFKTRQIEKYGVLAVITKFNACQFFLLYSMLIVMVASREHWLCSCTHRSPTSFLGRTLTPPLFLHTSLLWPTRSTRTCSQRDGRSAASSLGSQVLERLRAASSLSSTSFMSQNQWRTS